MQQHSPLLTVLMAVYNNEEFVEDAINSILTQTYSNFEFLIIEDASSDSSFSIIELVSGRDPRIHVVRNKNNFGLGYCLRMGTRQAFGKYLARMDADDLSFPNRLEVQVDYLEKNQDIDIVGSTALEIDFLGNVGRFKGMPALNKQIVENIWACPIIHPSVTFRRQRIIDVGNYDGTLRRRQDYELWFRCVKNGLKFSNIQMPLIYYRFDHITHRKQSLELAIQQVKIGLNGCKMLKLPWWQKAAVTTPVWRAILPSSFQHFIYKFMSLFDPRNRKTC